MRALQPVVQRPVPAPRSIAQSHMVQRPVPAPRSIAPRPVVQRPVPAPRPVVQRPVVQRSILNKPIPSSTSSSVLVFSRPDSSNLASESVGFFSTLTTAARSVASYVANRYNDIVHWIEPYVSEVVKKKVSDTGIEINKKIESLKSLVFKTVNKNSTAVKKNPTAVDKNPTAVNKPKIEIKLTNHAVKNVARQFSYEVEGEEQDVSSFLNRARDEVLKILRENKNKKVSFVLTCHMSRLSIVTGEEITRTVPFACKYRIVLEATDLGELYDTAKGEILENISKYSSNRSNWKVSNILKMDINMINYNPLSSSSWIKLNKFLASKKAVINMENEDNECFKWCVTRALNMKNKNNERIDKELIEKSKELNWKGIEFPFKLNQIAKFEENNPDISVSVFRL